jgi:hypothetical protein
MTIEDAYWDYAFHKACPKEERLLTNDTALTLLRTMEPTTNFILAIEATVLVCGCMVVISLIEFASYMICCCFFYFFLDVFYNSLLNDRMVIFTRQTWVKHFNMDSGWRFLWLIIFRKLL